MDLNDPYTAQFFKVLVIYISIVALVSVLVLGYIILEPKTFKDYKDLILGSIYAMLLTGVGLIVFIPILLRRF